MTERSTPIIDDLPEVIPVFPLPGVLLLPHGHLPLNIFEPRYLNMVEDAMCSGRMLAMIQTRAEEANPVPEGAEIFTMGCVGRIVSFVESGRGNYLITLAGLSRFRVIEELKPMHGYRRVRARYDEFGNDLAEDSAPLEDRGRLLEAMLDFFDAQDMEGDWSELEKAPDSLLVNSLAMICPFEPQEKQALLECTDTRARGALLTTLLEMASHEGDMPPSGGLRH